MEKEKAQGHPLGTPLPLAVGFGGYNLGVGGALSVFYSLNVQLSKIISLNF